MTVQGKILECVPNFSEGRDQKKIDRIVHVFRGKPGLKLLDYQSDRDHNRMVVTVAGNPGPLRDAIVEAAGVAIELIDMRQHQGQHPRMGAIDVIPFVPVSGIQLSEAIDISRQLAKMIAEKYGLPIFLYEESATSASRKDLAAIRKGQFEGMAEKLRDSRWKPDFGPDTIHETAGVTAIGARMPLIAFNVNLDTDRIEIAANIAKRVRQSSGGLPYCKAIGVDLKQKGLVQVSMNMTNYTRTGLHMVLEVIRGEAEKYGVNVVESEIVGMVPMSSLIDSAVYYMGIKGFSMDQILEYRIMEQ